MRNYFVPVLLALAFLPCDAAQPLHVKWADLSIVVGRQVSVALPDGVVRGKALSVDADALVVKVKGKPVRVPRANLRRFEMENKGVKYRVVGTTVGTLGGFAGGAGAAIGIQGGIFGDNNPAGAATALVGIWTAGTVGGYLLGNAADKHWTPVEILD